MSDFICIAKIISAHGIKGQVKVKSFSENLLSYKEFTDKSGKVVALKNIKFTSQDIYIASVNGVTDRNQAELLKNTELFIHKNSLPETDENEFYYEDQIGKDVMINNKKIGTVTGVFNFGAGDFFEVLLTSEKTLSVHTSACEINDTTIVCEEEQLV